LKKPYYEVEPNSELEETEMCEFEVFVKGKVVFKDAVYAKTDGNKVILKDVLGVSKVFEDCKIVEIDVNSERLVLSMSS